MIVLTFSEVFDGWGFHGKFNFIIEERWVFGWIKLEVFEKWGAIADCSLEQGNAFSIKLLKNFAIDGFLGFGFNEDVRDVLGIFKLDLPLIQFFPFGLIIFLNSQDLLLRTSILQPINLLILLLDFKVNGFLVLLVGQIFSLELNLIPDLLLDAIMDYYLLVIIRAMNLVQIFDHHAKNIRVWGVTDDPFAKWAFD